MGAPSTPQRMRRIFVDSAYWIGLRDKGDPHHHISRKVAKWLVENRLYLVVTPFIFAETHAYFSRIPEIRELVIRDFWNNPIVNFEQPTFQDQTEALKILKQGDKTYSFADAVSFVVMSRLGLQDVVTYDRHFRQFGKFNVIDGDSI
jgi:predicted nucleic acid-binding protein